MKIIRIDNQQYKMACANLKRARQYHSWGDKLEKSAKNFIEQDLKARNVNPVELIIGETLIIKLKEDDSFKDCIRITAKSSNRVDLNKLKMDFPVVEAECRRDFSSVYYDVLWEEGDVEIGGTLGESIKRLEEKKKELEKSISALEKLGSKISLK